MGEQGQPFVVKGFDQNGYDSKRNDVNTQCINPGNDVHQVGKHRKPGQ